MASLEVREMAVMVLAYMQEHEIDILTAYKQVTEFLTEQEQPYPFQEVKQYIFDHPEIQY